MQRKSDLVFGLSLRMGLDRATAQEAVDAVLGLVAKSLHHGHEFSLHGFGTFRLRERPARTARNPQTGDPIAVPPRRVVTFTPASTLKQAVADGGRERN